MVASVALKNGRRGLAWLAVLGACGLPACREAAPAPPVAALPPGNWLAARLLDPDQGRAADVRRLRAALAARPTGVLEFRLLRRLGIYLSYSPTPDSALPYLWRARRVARPFETSVPLEMSAVLERLSNWHWQHQSNDSARYYHLGAARLLARAFATDSQQTRAYFIEGQAAVPAILIAEHYANAGLASQAQSRLTEAMRYFDQARRAYQQVPTARPGLAWVHTLFAETLKAQGQPARSAAHYEQALRILRQDRPRNPDRVAQHWNELLQPYAPQLLDTNPAHLLDLATEGFRDLEPLLRRQPQNRDLLRTALDLTLLQAQARLASTPAGDISEVLARGRQLQQRLYRAAGPDFRAALGYYPASATLAMLRAQQAQLAGQPARYGQLRAQALAHRDSVAEREAQVRVGFGLAQRLVQLRDFGTAIGVLRPLVAARGGASDQATRLAAYRLLTRSYSAIGQADSAFRAQSQAAVLADALRDETQQRALAEAETRFRTSLQEVRINELTREAARQRRETRWAWVSAGLLTLLLAVAAVLGWRLRRAGTVLTLRNEALALARATQDRLYAIIGHDLRTPLIALETLPDLIDYYYQPAHADPDALREVAMEVRFTTAQLTDLLDNLLHWAASQTGELAYHPEAVAASTLLHDITSLYAAPARTRHVAIAVAAPDGLPLLWADRNMVLAQLRNLFSNALKAAPTGSTITLGAGLGPAGTVELWVADTGRGLSADQLALLTQPPHPDGLGQRLAGQWGTGLGLPLVRQLAQRQGGSFVLESVPGHGTTARVRLPAESLKPAL